MNVAELSSILSRATGEGFYRRLYGMQRGQPPLSVGSLEEWRAVPLLTKKDLLGATLAERSFVPIPDIDYISSSSGTTGTLPLFSPRSQLAEYEYREHFSPNAVLSSTPVPHQQEWYLQVRDIAPRVVVIDPRNPAVTARLARAAGVDAIYAFLFHLPIIAEHLVHEGVARQIRHIEITGESCSRSGLEALEREFPNAVITSCYGTSEVENSPMGVPCRPLSREASLSVYHPKEGIGIEFVDSETEKALVPEADTEGEIVITAYRGEPAAFPFIRYRTGDTGRVVETHCPQHGTFSFAVVGRIDMDSVKIPGGMLQADEIERALRLFPEDVEDTFEAHLFENASGGIRVSLRVMPKRTLDLSEFAGRVAAAIRISPDSTYAEAAARRLFHDLECEKLEDPGFLGKRKRIVRHSQERGLGSGTV